MAEAVPPPVARPGEHGVCRSLYGGHCCGTRTWAVAYNDYMYTDEYKANCDRAIKSLLQEKSPDAGAAQAVPRDVLRKMSGTLLLLQPGTILGSHGPRILRDV